MKRRSLLLGGTVGSYMVRPTLDGKTLIQKFGANGDRPVPKAFIP